MNINIAASVCARKKRVLLPIFMVFCFGLIGGANLFGQNSTDTKGTNTEDDFFNSSNVEATQGQADVKNMEEAVDKEMVGLSGNLAATGSYTMTRDFLWGLKGISDNSFNYNMTGDLLLDVRLKKGFKAFVDLFLGYSNFGMPNIHQYTLLNPVDTFLGLETIPTGSIFYMSEDQQMLLSLKEIFVDFNISNVVYFRVGKQVLQWGLGYLWNPTDLINIEKKSFTDLSALRDGTFGARVDVVFSPTIHLYTFLGFQGVESISDVALAARAVFLVGTVEFGVSGWAKDSKIPVFGLDISAPLFWSLNFYAEASASWGFNSDKMRPDGSTYSIRDRLVPRITAGLSRSFDLGDVQDRIQVNVEFYYNDAGYNENMFESANRAAFLQGGYYSSGDYGKVYGALFITINKIFTSNTTLTLSGLGNFSDLSFMVMADLSYTPVNNFTISFKLISYLGSNFREYTIAFNSSDLTATPGNNMFAANIGCTVNF
jgi:hypothetical protein